MTSRPLKSLQLSFFNKEEKVDVALWEGSYLEQRVLPSSVSIRLLDAPNGIVMLKAEEALRIANVLQHYAFECEELDRKRRIDAWKYQTKEKSQGTNQALENE